MYHIHKIYIQISVRIKISKKNENQIAYIHYHLNIHVNEHYYYFVSNSTMNTVVWKRICSRLPITDSVYSDVDKMFAIKIFERDIDYLNANIQRIIDPVIRNECFAIAIVFSNETKIIDLLHLELKPDMNYVDANGNNYLMCVCEGNSTKFEIIKYIIDEYKFEMDNISVDGGYNCFHNVLMNNTNVSIIKKLFEHYYERNNHTDNDGNDYLLTACRWNNVAIVKYLVEDIKLDINVKNNQGLNCFHVAISNDDTQCVQYIISCTNVNLSLKEVSFEDFKKVINLIKYNHDKFIILVDMGFFIYEFETMLGCITYIDPLLLNERFRNLIGVYDPFDETFSDFVSHVDSIPHVISLNTKIYCDTPKTIKKTHHNNFRKHSELLFRHMGEPFFGSREIVYNRIPFLKALMNDECIKFDDDIQIDTPIPTYIMDMYIESCYSHSFDLNEMDPKDLIPLLKFIDQYPTDVFAINLIEIQLINYMYTNSIVPCKYIKNICNKYQLKYLYLLVHNSEYVTKL